MSITQTLVCGGPLGRPRPRPRAWKGLEASSLQRVLRRRAATVPQGCFVMREHSDRTSDFAENSAENAACIRSSLAQCHACNIEAERKDRAGEDEQHRQSCRGVGGMGLTALRALCWVLDLAICRLSKVVLRDEGAMFFNTTHLSDPFQTPLSCHSKSCTVPRDLGNIRARLPGQSAPCTQGGSCRSPIRPAHGQAILPAEEFTMYSASKHRIASMTTHALICIV